MAIITLSRQMGSGGIAISHDLAERLGYTLIDGEALKRIAPDYGMSPEALEKADEKPPAYLDKLDEKTEINFHQIQLIVLEHALKGNVIIYGRGGQDLLRTVPSVLRVRIIAPFETRVERWTEREWLDPELARILVRKSDQQRAGFIRYYFDRDWDEPLNYDLVINTERIGEEKAVDLIAQAAQDPNLTAVRPESKQKLQDLIIQKKAKIRLLSSGVIDGFHQYHITVEVADRVVTLGGHVHSKEAKEQALKEVSGIEGVVSTEDHLQIRQYRSSPSEH